uniref:alcohol dehydrogenase catalytic domain-containing protein n=1 Tax=Alicyclobacillus tolerans TaxID=90970 RepID=UPI003556CCE5
MWHNRRDVRIETVPDPVIRHSDEVLVDVSYCGICGSDREEYFSGPVTLPVNLHPVSGYKVPLILGHEIVGRVRTAPKNSTLSPGDTVCIESLRSCGTCRFCMQNQEYLCRNLICIGLQTNGGMCEQIIAPDWACHKLPKETPTPAGALVEPMSVVMHAWEAAAVGPYDRIGIIGAGTIGLGLAIWCVKNGVSPTVFEVQDDRKRLALLAGATATSIEQIEDYTENFDVVFECSGQGLVLQHAVTIASRAGRVIALGIHGHSSPFNPTPAILKEVTIKGVVGNTHEHFTKSLEWVSSDPNVLNLLVGNVVNLEEVVPFGFEQPKTDLGKPKILVGMG